jgi:hypothetical protein
MAHDNIYKSNEVNVQRDFELKLESLTSSSSPGRDTGPEIVQFLLWHLYTRAHTDCDGFVIALRMDRCKRSQGPRQMKLTR